MACGDAVHLKFFKHVTPKGFCVVHTGQTRGLQGKLRVYNVNW